MINDKESINKIEEIYVTQNIKYLDVIIDNKKNVLTPRKINYYKMV